jgi:hypothetical protein
MAKEEGNWCMEAINLFTQPDSRGRIRWPSSWSASGPAWLSQKESAGRIGVDPGTLAKWERREREPTGGFLELVKRILQHGEDSGA